MDIKILILCWCDTLCILRCGILPHFTLCTSQRCAHSLLCQYYHNIIYQILNLKRPSDPQSYYVLDGLICHLFCLTISKISTPIPVSRFPLLHPAVDTRRLLFATVWWGSQHPLQSFDSHCWKIQFPYFLRDGIKVCVLSLFHLGNAR